MRFLMDIRHILFGLLLSLVLPTSLNADQLTPQKAMQKCAYEGKHEFPLVRAVQLTNIVAAKCLIAKGYDVNQKLPKTTILTIAVYNTPSSPELVKLLLENGAKPVGITQTLSDDLGFTLMSISREYYNALDNEYEPPLDEASRLQQLKEMRMELRKFPIIMKMLLEHGMVLKASDKNLRVQSGSWTLDLLEYICSKWEKFDYKNTGLVELIIKTNKDRAQFSQKDLLELRNWGTQLDDKKQANECHRMIYQAFGK